LAPNRSVSSGIQASIQASTNRVIEALDTTTADILAHVDETIISSHGEMVSFIDDGLSRRFIAVSSHIDTSLDDLKYRIADEIWERLLLSARNARLPPEPQGMPNAPVKVTGVPEQSQDRRGAAAPDTLSSVSHGHPDRLYPSLLGKGSPTCASRCLCQCHRRSTRFQGSWNLNALQVVLGNLLLSYSATLKQKKPCTVESCQGSAKEGYEVRFQYRFPSWLLNMSVSLQMGTTTGSPELLLRVHHQVTSDSLTFSQSAFGCIERGDLDGLKQLLRRRPACVSDVTAADGTTPISHAIDVGNLEMVNLLLQAGADLFHSNYHSQTAVSIAALMSWGPTDYGRALGNLLEGPISEFVEERGYHIVHKILIGRLPLRLSDALADPAIAALADVPSPGGFPPLHLAAANQDLEAVELLVRAGADVNRKGKFGDSPLIFAAAYANYDMAKFFIENGADVNVQASDGLTPLLAATRGPNNLVLPLLIESGANLTVADISGNSVLDHAVRNEEVSNVKRLVGLDGVDLNCMNETGRCPLYEAIHRKLSDMVEVLLENGADYRLVDDNGWGMLHWLASAPDPKTMQVIRDADVAGVDTQLKDNNGKSPVEVLRSGKVAAKLQREFEELLLSLGTTQEEDVYFDAVEA